MRVLVLGGGGFIGSHVVAALVRAGHTVRVLGRSPVIPARAHSAAEYLVSDLSDRQALAQALSGTEAVYHLISSSSPATAEFDPVVEVQANLIGTLGLLAEMERQSIQRLVFLSSGGMVYGNPRQLPVPETHPLVPSGSYGIVKVAIEGFLARQSSRGLVPVILRASNAYGPGQTKIGVLGFINTVLERLATGKPLELMGDGSVVRDFIHLTDLADLCVRALSAKTAITVNAGSGSGASLSDVIALAEKVTGRKVDIIRSKPRAFDVPVSILDIGRAREVFGWAPTVSLEDGIAQTWDWVQSGMFSP